MFCGNDKTNKFFIPKIFRKKEPKAVEDSFDSSFDLGESSAFSVSSKLVFTKSFSERQSTSRDDSINFSGYGYPMPSISDTRSFRVFVATWNVGGKSPHIGLNLNNFLPSDDQSDIYVLGFQEIVPLNAGNVLVIEDNEPAAKWLALINQALNKPQRTNAISCATTPSHYTKSFSSLASSTKTSVSQDLRTLGDIQFSQRSSLKAVTKTLRTEKGRRLKTCNCPSQVEKKNYKDSCFRCPQAYISEEDSSSGEDEDSSSFVAPSVVVTPASTTKKQRYCLIACKQMVGIFVTVWVRRELVQHIGHLRLSSVGRGIMGYLGNKGCISVSMSLHQTSFCFVCSHLASGEKEGDERRRNFDVIEILKNTQFSNICKKTGRRIPEKILEHDRVIWLGDLNYRIALSYIETRKLLEDNNWDALFEKDQLKIEREAGRVFEGWNEGKIYFAPTYKYSNNSDAYAGDAVTSKKKRRTPAWCDRILWHGGGIQQLSYVRGESRFSDHRPVCALFEVEVGVLDGRMKKGSCAPNMKIGAEELLPPPSFPYKSIGTTLKTC